MALANSMRLSLMKAAHADAGGAPWQEIRVARLFRPTYASANVGHPSRVLDWIVFVVVLLCDLLLMVWRCGIPHLAKNERDVGHPGVVDRTELGGVVGF